MHSSLVLRCLVALAGACYALAPLPASAQTCPVGDTCFSDSFELPFNFPANDAEAARFLNQATFGATAADISAVRQQSVAVWLENQLNSGTTTLSRPFLEQWAVANNGVDRAARIQRWYNVAVTAPDQVRQRVAYALSQIVITSDADEFLSNEPIMMAEWNDLITRNALGNYRELLRQATFSPMMGRYLTTYRNRKFELNRNGSTYSAGNSGVQPDENYAREVMQLFSFGLLLRQTNFYDLVDGDPVLPGIQPQPTYDEQTISTLARVFTGLAYNCSATARTVGGITFPARQCSNSTNPVNCTGTECRFENAVALFGAEPPRDPVQNRGLVHPDWYEPLVCYPRYHDTGYDMTGVELPDPDSPPAPLPAGSPAAIKRIQIAGTPDLVINPAIEPSSGQQLNCNSTANPSTLTAVQQAACVNYCEGSINQAIDKVVDHPNTPTTVARQLIQRLVTSNPSPGYVQRVGDAFRDNGAGVRGDLKAVVRAILLDSEARRPPTDPATPVNFGKPREPLLKLVQIWRNLGYVSGDTGNFANGQPSRRRWGPDNPQDQFQQRPLGAPSVFNFYEPDYKQPGVISQVDINGAPSASGLFSPELQIIHEVSAITAANELLARICSGYGGDNCTGNLTVPNNRAYVPAAVVDSWPSTVSLDNLASVDTQALVNLIEFFNTRLLGGTMTGTINTAASCASGVGTGAKRELYFLLRCPGGLSTITGATAAERDRRRKLYLLHIIAASPDFSYQR